MNIFVLDPCPFSAARMLANKHIVKMPTEQANMLLWPFKQVGLKLPKTKKGETIKLTHFNHPSSQFVRASHENYLWSVNHLTSLLEEYSRRYKRAHFAENYLNFINENFSKLNFARRGMTPFARCFSSFKQELEEEKDSILAYQKFYLLDKEPFARWPSIEKIPSFWPKYEKYIDPSFKDGIYTKRS